MLDTSRLPIDTVATMAKQKFAAFDIDGTLFRSGLYREVSYELIKMGKIPDSIAQELNELHRKWRHRLHGNAFEEFEVALVNVFDELSTQIKICDYDEAVRRVLEKKAENVYVYTRNLIQQLKQDGYFLIAISGSQIDLVEPFAKKYGFDAWVGQEWERGEEFFTGQIKKSHTNKEKFLERLIAENNLILEDSIAVGDSNGDAGMLSYVKHPIAFNPTAELYEKAIKNGWRIVVERKTIAYELTKGRGKNYSLTNVSLF